MNKKITWIQGSLINEICIKVIFLKIHCFKTAAYTVLGVNKP